MRHLTLRIVLSILAISLAGLSGGCSANSSTARHVERADQYFAAGKFSEAEIEYMNALKANPDDPHAIAQLGLLYYEQGRIARAYPFVMKARDLNPNDLDLRVKAAQLSLASGDAAKARQEAEAVLLQSPTNSEAPVLLVESARTTNELAEVRQRLEELRRQIGDTAAVELALGSLSLRVGDLQEAEAALKRAVALDPQSADAHMALGTAYWLQQKLEEADTEMKKAADLSPARSPRRLRYADFKLKTGEIDASKALLTEMTKTTPDYVPAWTSLAEIALAQRDLTNCATLINKALTHDPQDYNSLLLRARLRLAQRDGDRAVAELESLSARFDKSPQIHYFLTGAHLLKENPTEALRSVTRALALNPDYDEAVLLQAQLNIRRGNPDAAIIALNQFLQRRPAVPQPYLLLIQAHVAKGNLTDALGHCQRLGELYPTNAQVPLLTGTILMRQRRTDEARKQFERAMEMAPEALAPFEQLVNLDLAAGQPETALTRIQQKIEQWPESPVLPVLLANVYSTQNETNKAEAALLKAIELEPSHQAAHMMLARLYINSKQNDKALERLQQAVEANPRDVGSLLLIGVLQSEQQDYAAARATYEKLLAVNPNFGAAWNNLAYVCSEKLGDPAKAYEAARKARELMPNDPYVADTLGWVLYLRGDYPAALNLLQESAEKLTDQPEVQFHLGMAYYMMADQERARAALNRALSTAASAEKDFPGIDDARQRLAVLELGTQGSGAEVLSALEKRVAEQPNDPIALIKLAGLYQAQGSQEKAIGAYEKLLSHHPRNPRAIGRLSLLYSENPNQTDKALNLAKEAYRLAPDDAEISHILGRQVFASGDHRWGLSLLQQAAQRQTPTPDMQYDLAMAQYSVGRVADAEAGFRATQNSEGTSGRAAQAVQMLELISLGTPAKAAEGEARAKQVLQATPDSVPALMVVALSAEKRGEPAAAMQAYDLALKKFPHFLPAIRGLAILEAGNPRDEKAAYDLAMRARQALPDDPDVAKALGQIMYRRGDFRNATRLLSEGIQKGAADGPTLFYLGMSHLRLNDSQQGKDTLGRALTLNLPAELAEQARQALARLEQP